MKFKSSLKPLTLAVLRLSCAAAQADITIDTTRAPFLAALTSSGTDTFNDLAMAPTGSPLLRAAGAFAYRASSGPVNAFYPAGTSPDIWLSTQVATDTMTFDNFTAGIRGIRGFGGNFSAPISTACSTPAARWCCRPATARPRARSACSIQPPPLSSA